MEKKAETKSLIIEAGERALAKYGFRKLTMVDIAEEAGLAKRTIYLHFGSKSEICLAVMDGMLDRSLNEMDRALAGPGSGLERLRQVLTVRLWSRVESVLPYHHSLAEAVRAVYPGKVEDFKTLAGPDVARVAQAIRIGQEDGTIRRFDSDEMAELLVRGSNGFLPSALGAKDMRSTEVLRDQIGTFIDVLVRGVSASNG